MTNKKQSSVEQMWEELDNLIPFKDNATAQKFSDILDKYKAMHKEEIVNTWTEATAPPHEIGLSDTTYILAQIKKAEQYYNETFGGGR